MGSQSIWLLEPIFSEHQSTLFFYFLSNHEKPVSPIQLFRLSEHDDGSLPSSRIMTPGQRNPVSNSKERQFYEFRLVLFVECMVPTLQRIIVGNILNNTSVSVKHISQRSNQRHLCKNKRRRQTTKKISKQGLRGPQRVQQLSVKLRAMCWRPGKIQLFRVSTHTVSKTSSLGLRSGFWVFSGTHAADNFP